MDQNQDQSLFDMNMTSATQGHLLSISKWGKFISVTGFIIGALILLMFAAYGQAILKQVTALMSFGDSDVAGVLIAVVVIVCLLMGCWIFFLFKSASLLKRGLQNQNTTMLADGFKAMRIYFVFSLIMSVLSILSTLQTLL